MSYDAGPYGKIRSCGPNCVRAELQSCNKEHGPNFNIPCHV